MTNRIGLGRGLSALLPEDGAPARDVHGSGFCSIAVGQIRPNPRQPRGAFDAETIETLADSVRRVGVLQPLIVRHVAGGYELIAGERRLRAARLAGLDVVPAIVKNATDAESLEQSVLENIQRQDLNPLEEAAAYRQLMEDFSLTHESVAARVGKSRVAITNTVRLLTLPGELQELVADGSMTGGHARALLGVEDPGRQRELARRVVDEGLSVRQTEEAVRRLGEDPAREKPGSRPSGHPALLEVGDLMGDYLNTKVDVRMGKSTGRMVIEFGSLTDLERITQLILGPDS